MQAGSLFLDSLWVVLRSMSNIFFFSVVSHKLFGKQLRFNTVELLIVTSVMQPDLTISGGIFGCSTNCCQFIAH